MENPEEILHSLEEFSKSKPKDIPRELEEYLCFVAKTGDPVYQWSAIKSLFREKMLNVIQEFYETCPSVEIPPCPNVDLFNYDVMKNFILEKLDTFAAAPFTVQRICELLTTPRKEYNRIDKYMRALEKNILVVSTTEPGGRRNTENGEGIMNGLESEHLPETSNSSNDINVEEMDDTPSWPRVLQNENVSFQNNDQENSQPPQIVQETVVTASKISEAACSSSQDTVITCRSSEDTYVSIEPVPSNTCTRQDSIEESDVSVTITAIPAGVQKRRNSVEPVVSSDSSEQITESGVSDNSDKKSDDASKEEDVKSEEQEVSSQEVKDADSSSNPEDEEEESESSESKEEKTTSSGIASPVNFDENASMHSALSSTAEVQDQIDVTATSDPKENESVESVNNSTVDTTKCSESPQSEDKQEEIKESSDDSEITSSDKVVSKTESSEEMNSDEAEAKVENSASEADSLSSDDSVSKVEESQSADVDSQVSSDKAEVVEKEEGSGGDCTPMEVDENDSDKAEEIVKAEATSDSPL